MFPSGESWGEVATGRKPPATHPGKVLRDEFLEPMKISVYSLAQAIKVPRSRFNDIVLDHRGYGFPFGSLFRDDARAVDQSAGPFTTWTWRTGRYAAVSSARSGGAQPEGASVSKPCWTRFSGP